MLKRSKTFRKLLSLILASLVIYVGVNYTISKLNKSPTPPVVISQIKKVGIVEEKVLHKEVITNKFNTIQKIQVIQTSVTQSVTIQHGFNNKFFKNNKLIKFTGIGSYSLDLSKINENNIVINNTDKTISIFITKPLAEIELLEEKTEFQDEKGFLIISEVEQTPEEYEQLKYEVKSEMKMKLNGTEYNEIVKTKTIESLEGILNKLTNNEYIVKINFVE